MYFDLSNESEFAVSDSEMRASIADPKRSPAVFRELRSILSESERHRTSELIPTPDRAPNAWIQIHQILGDVLSNLEANDARALVDSLTTSGDVSWQLVPRTANALAILYNFIPFADTGSTVASKRLRQFGDIFDVFSCDMSSRKGVDRTVPVISEPYIGEHVTTDLVPTWANARGITNFALRALRFADRQLASGKHYDYIYTRAMWIDSIFAGARIKFDHADIPWVAEFSDPLSLDVEGHDRRGAAPTGEFFETLLLPVTQKYGRQERFLKTVFGAAELLVYAAADRIIFTNELQRQTMVNRIENAELRQRVNSVAEVSNHPTLPDSYYHACPVSYEVDSTVVNIGYFGEFYANRGLQDITRAITEVDGKSRVHLHVFTDYAPGAGGQINEKMSARVIDGLGGENLEFVHVNPSLPYLEFLSATELFDYLVVTDARSGEQHSVNPYLPSKWSDYRGSSAKTWALVEQSSSLDSMHPALKTNLGDKAETREVIRMMLTKFKDRFEIEGTRAPRAERAKASNTTSSNDTDVRLDSPTDSNSSPTAKGESESEVEHWQKFATIIRAKLSGSLPAGRGPLYPPDMSRVVHVTTSRDAFLPADTRISVTPVVVPDPSQGSVGDQADLVLAKGKRAELASTLLATDIAAIARRNRASAIVVDLTPITSFSALWAARLVGVPIILNAGDSHYSNLDLPGNQNSIDLTNSLDEHEICDSLSDMIAFVFANSDAVISQEASVRGRAAALGLPSDAYLRRIDIFKNNCVDSREPMRPQLTLVGEGDGFDFDQVSAVTRVSISDFEAIDPIRESLPDTVVIDVRGLSGIRTLDKTLWKLGGAGVSRIVIIDDSLLDPELLGDVLKQTDVLIGTSNTGKLRLSEAGTLPARAVLSLPAEGSRGGTSWTGWYTNSNLVSTEGREILHKASGHTDIDRAVLALRASGVNAVHPRAISEVKFSSSRGIENGTLTVHSDEDAKAHEIEISVAEAIFRTTPMGRVSVFDSEVVAENNVNHGGHVRIELTEDDTPEARTDMVPDSGISLILPTFQGRDRIRRMLDSIRGQSIPLHLVEVIVVANGKPDGTAEVVRDWASENPTVALDLIVIDEPGVSNARNVGLAHVTRDWVTFVDDDDYLGTNYLLSMYVRRIDGAIVMGCLSDVSPDGIVDTATSQNRNVASIGHQVVSLASRWHVLSLNAGKLLPAEYATELQYRTELRSGEDQVYMTNLLQFDPMLVAARKMSDAAYMRVRRDGSISRRDTDFNFSVIERLDVMKSLRSVRESHDSPGVRRATEGISRWHELAISRFAYADGNEAEISNVKRAIREAGFDPRSVLHPEVKDNKPEYG